LLGHKRLETTKIYTRVAVFKHQEIRSPLDVLMGAAAAPAARSLPAPQPPSRRPVGRLQIDLQPSKAEAGAANVTLSIQNEDRFVLLKGIVVREPRSGWVTLEVPPLEAWEKPLCGVTAAQRQRIESSEFYALIQEHVTRRYLAWKKSSGP
jgi:hypothetical protein